MKLTKNLIISTLLLVVSANIPAMALDNIPDGWNKAGSKPAEYEVGTDKISGKKIMYILGKTNNIDDFGTVMQTFNATKYQGKRLKLSGYLKSQNVNWAGMWMRVDGENKSSLSFDNMQNRPIKGTTNWKKYDIILDVPKESTAIAFGVLTSGKGKVWIKDISFQQVSTSVKTTDLNSIKNMKDVPTNLDFEN